MRKLMDKIKKNNKGFTLVELIVVVAVLAIITVVVAPQYIQYVDKARIGTDKNALGEIAHVAEIVYVEEQSKTNAATTEAVTLTVKIENGTAKYSGTHAAAVEKIVPAAQYKFKSSVFKNKTVAITVTNGVSNWNPDDTAYNPS